MAICPSSPDLPDLRWSWPRRSQPPSSRRTAKESFGASPGSFPAGTPKELFGYSFAIGGAGADDVSSDGKRFLVIQSGAESGAATSEIHFVLEWFEDIRRRVRAGG